MKVFSTTLSIFLAISAFGQARLVINNDAYITFDATGGAAYVVVDNANVNAITTLGTGGNIISEHEDARVKWNIGNNTGTYVVPLTTPVPAPVKMPLTLDITSAGTGNGDMVFATYEGPNWNNDGYRPSDVTHMFDYNTNTINNSAWVIDRFWIIDAAQAGFAYTIKPDVNITFGFDPNDIKVGNNMTPAAHNLGAQRFNAGPNLWGDMLPIGVDIGTAVTGAVVAGGDFFRSWTLSDYANPLPVELVEFTASCREDDVQLSWYTVSETNNESFTVEKSYDGEEFFEIGHLPGAINSQTVLSYSFTDHSANGLGLYRLKQTDLDGTYSYSDMVSIDCATSNGISIVSAYQDGSGQLNIVIDASSEGQFELEVLDLHGRSVVRRSTQQVAAGLSKLEITGEFAGGVYLVRLYNGEGSLVRKVVLDN